MGAGAALVYAVAPALEAVAPSGAAITAVRTRGATVPFWIGAAVLVACGFYAAYVAVSIHRFAGARIRLGLRSISMPIFPLRHCRLVKLPYSEINDVKMGNLAVLLRTRNTVYPIPEGWLPVGWTLGDVFARVAIRREFDRHGLTDPAALAALEAQLEFSGTSIGAVVVLRGGKPLVLGVIKDHAEYGTLLAKFPADHKLYLPRDLEGLKEEQVGGILNLLAAGHGNFAPGRR